MPEMQHRLLEVIRDRRDRGTSLNIPRPVGELLKLAESFNCYVIRGCQLEHKQEEEEGEDPHRPCIPTFDATRGESEHALREA